MLDRIECGEANGIIAWHPDRLARNAVDAGRIIDLIDRGMLTELKFQSYRFENSPEGKWMLGIVRPIKILRRQALEGYEARPSK